MILISFWLLDPSDHCDNDDGQLDSAHDRRDCGCCDNDHGEGDPDDGDGVSDQHDHNFDQDHQNQLKNWT